MKKITFLLFILSNCFVLAQTQESPLNILFVGNSITYYNNLPQTFKAISEEQGYHINLDQHTPGGTGFINHVGNATLYSKLDNTVWDYVILQPGSNESPAFSQPLADTIDRAKILRDKIYENSPCASIYFYEISYGIVDDSAASLQQYLDRQLLIKNNLIQMSNETNIPLAPIGETFQTSIQQNQAHFLWGGYGDIHPNTKGSFMGACTFYNALFQKPIINATVNETLSQADADYFRSIAENVTLNNLDDWNIDTLVAHANFTFSSNDGATVDFISTSTNFDAVSWDFGDGDTITTLNPSHVFDFSAQVSYDVYLTVKKGCKEHHFLQRVSQSSLSTVDFNFEESFSVFPNPVVSDLSISSKRNSKYSYKLFGVLGKQIKAEKNLKKSQKINISNLSKGIYILIIETLGQTKTFKIIKE